MDVLKPNIPLYVKFVFQGIHMRSSKSLHLFFVRKDYTQLFVVKKFISEAHSFSVSLSPFTDFATTELKSSISTFAYNHLEFLCK